MKNYKLTKDEKEILKAVENGEYISDFSEERLKELKEAAAATIKNKSINIRISSADLARLKSKSQEKGIPYQLIVSSMIHQYNQGKLKVEL